MKTLIISALCALGFASAYAEPMDHWEYDGGTSSMTDGEWTFKVQRRNNLIEGTDIYQFFVEGCTGYPDHLTTLDFDKPVIYVSYPSIKLAITQIQPGFNGSEAGQRIEVLKLPTHGYDFNMGNQYGGGSGFANCHNLVRIEPFLPDSCIAIGQGEFSGCEKLSTPLVWRGGSGMTTSGGEKSSRWQLFENTAIPSVDLSDASLFVVDRATFNGCTALKSVKLPKAMTELTGGVNPFNGCTALELVEFNSVPSSLSGFSGCTALKEVRFNHTAPSGSISAGVYSQLDQLIDTYLVLDDDESDKLEAWKAVTASGTIGGGSTWAATYAGSVALEKRPIGIFSTKSVSLAAGEDGSYTADQPGTFIISRGEGDSLDGMVTVNYTVSGGTAQSGVHFEPLSGTASIPSGSKTGVIEVTPMYFGYIGTETLTLKLAEGDYEIISGSDEATISLSTEALRSVSIAKGVDAEATSGQIGTFIISRGVGDALGGSITINYTIDAGSTARSGVHFEPLSGVATISAGEQEGVIEVTPKYFGYVGTETLTLKLAAGDYEIGTDAATISISTLSARSVSIAKGEDADEGAGTVGYFILSRGEGDQTSVPLEVALSVGGTAVAGQTYRPIGAVVTIPAGEKTLKVKVVPYDDPSVAEDSTVEVTILPGGYGIGTASATVTIVNGASYGGWKFVGEKGTSISDGTWTFAVSRRPNDKFDDGVYHLWVQGCTAYPSAPTALDFGKAFHNFYDGTYYMIRQLEMNFGGNTAAAAAVGSVVLPDDPGYKYRILGGCFQGCPNLTSITPFLPRNCESVSRGTFNDLTSLTNGDIRFYGSDFGETSGWEIMRGCTSVTNADFSGSTITALRRDCFQNCTSLKTVTLPATLKEFGWPGHANPGTMNRTPFNGVGGVKVIFTGGALPIMTYQDGNVAAIEFTTPVAELPDNAFANYYSIYSSPRLSSITFVGPPPATIGNDLFTGGYNAEAITVNVPAEYIAQWREIADDKVLTKEGGGTWTSGTTQLINVYGEPVVRSGFAIIVR